MSMNAIFVLIVVAFFLMGTNALAEYDSTRGFINYGIAAVCILVLILMRTNIPLRILPIAPLVISGIFCVFLIHSGGLYFWLGIWVFPFAMMAIFLCGLKIGVFLSFAGIIAVVLVMYIPTTPASEIDPQIKLRFIACYLFILVLTIIFEGISLIKDRKEKELGAEIKMERNNLVNLVKIIKTKINTLKDTGFQLSDNMSKTSKAVDNISDDFNEIKSKEARAQEVDKRTRDALNLIKTGFESLVKLIEEQSGSVNTSSSAIE